MSRTAGRRTSRHLESTAEDAAVLFTALLSSPVPLLPEAVAAATSNGGSGRVRQSEDGADQRQGHPTESAAAAAATKTAGLDWLAGVFRLGLACEKAAPGEAASALASAPAATSGALARFLAAAGATDADAEAPAPGRRFARGVRRAEAGARWLACRLMACGGDGGRGQRPWAALRRDSALQVRAMRGFWLFLGAFCFFVFFGRGGSGFCGGLFVLSCRFTPPPRGTTVCLSCFF